MSSSVILLCIIAYVFLFTKILFFWFKEGEKSRGENYRTELAGELDGMRPSDKRCETGKAHAGNLHGFTCPSMQLHAHVAARRTRPRSAQPTPSCVPLCLVLTRHAFCTIIGYSSFESFIPHNFSSFKKFFNSYSLRWASPCTR